MPPKSRTAQNIENAQAVQRMIDNSAPLLLTAGEVMAVQDDLVLVQVYGSAGLQRALKLHHTNDIQIGDTIVLSKAGEQHPWYALGIIQQTRQGISGGKYVDGQRGTLAPPEDFTATGQTAAIFVTWSAPVHLSVSFQLQHNSAEHEVGAASVYINGSSFIWPGADYRYFRIRTVIFDGTSTPRTSSWTAWTGAQASTVVSGGGYTQYGSAVVVDGDYVKVDGDQVVIKAPYALADLYDVDVSDIADGEPIVWDASVGKFVRSGVVSTTVTINNEVVTNSNGTPYYMMPA